MTDPPAITRGLVRCLWSIVPSVLLLLATSGCERRISRQINLFSDAEAQMVYSVRYYFSREHRIGINVFDSHDYSGAAATARLTAERENARMDVYWSGDAVYCELLSKRGLAIPYRPITQIAPRYRDPQNHWIGLAARARVLLVTRSLRDKPQSIRDLTNPTWKDRGALSDPLRGTTRSHFAALAALWGDRELAKFYDAILQNGVQITPDGEASAELVTRGEKDFALVDTDIALRRLQQHPSLDIVYPDRGQRDIGVMVMPNALMIVKGCKDFDAAQQFVDFLTSPAGEARIIQKEPSHLPLLASVANINPYIPRVDSMHVMPTDYSLAADKIQHMEKILGPVKVGQSSNVVKYQRATEAHDKSQPASH